MTTYPRNKEQAPHLLKAKKSYIGQQPKIKDFCELSVLNLPKSSDYQETGVKPPMI